MKYLQYAVYAVIASVALYDCATGAMLLFSQNPHDAHGADTVWQHLGPLIAQGGDSAQAALSTLRRLGAFGMFAGLTTLVWLTYGILRDRAVVTTLMIAYMVAGLFFLYTDTLFFEGTPYFAIKQAIGAVWFLAFVAHMVIGRRAKKAADAPE